ncbi:MAG: hypothetical protein ACR2OC_07705 [Solirubrobacterales bacterium]
MLDRRAAARGESGNRLAGRLLDEALRTDEHPLIGFRSGADGKRGPALIGTRLRVAQVVQTLRASEGDATDAARYLGVEPRHVNACIDYYAEFKEEIDREIEADLEFARSEQERAKRRREAVS